MATRRDLAVETAYWKTNAGDTASGPCPRCAALDGRESGDGWDVNGFGKDRGLVGPPPLHPHCACAVEWRVAEQHDTWPVDDEEQATIQRIKLNIIQRFSGDRSAR